MTTDIIINHSWIVELPCHGQRRRVWFHGPDQRRFACSQCRRRWVLRIFERGMWPEVVSVPTCKTTLKCDDPEWLLAASEREAS